MTYRWLDKIANANSDDPLKIGYCPTFLGQIATSALSLAAVNDCSYSRVYAGMTITKIGLGVANQSGNISVAAYRRSGSGRARVPNQLLGGLGLTGARTVTDGVTTNGSPVVTSATAAFSSTDLHKTISGTGIPANSYVGVVNSATSVSLSSNATSNVAVNATADGTGISVTLAAGIACPPATWSELTLPAPVNLRLTDFLALSCDNTTATFNCANGQALNMHLGHNFKQVTAFPCPTTVGTLVATQSRTPALIGIP